MRQKFGITWSTATADLISRISSEKSADRWKILMLNEFEINNFTFYSKLHGGYIYTHV